VAVGVLDPDGGYEEFDYNSFNEVTAHRRCKDSSTVETESFVYDTRGLKQSWTDAAGGLTTYSYYTSADNGGVWTDRLKTVIHPANVSGFQATETYEYDHAFDQNGNQTATPAAGRGLVTKITYADGNSVTKTYNQYGDVLASSDELGHTTTFTYDDYGRVLTTTTPPRFAGDTQNHTTTNSYVPTGKMSSYITTSTLPFSTTLPSGKVTTFEYDANWRKTFVHQAPGTSDAANTQYIYDQGTRPADGSTNIGLLTSMIDPRNYSTTYTYDIPDRQISITDALSHATSFTLDVHGNKTSETHANGELITYDLYDPMNRLQQKTTHRDATTTDVIHMTYDCAGNLATNIDENGNTYSFRLKPEFAAAFKRPGFSYDSPKRMCCHSFTSTFSSRSQQIQVYAQGVKANVLFFDRKPAAEKPWSASRTGV